MTEANARHTPVLSEEVMEYLAVREGGTYADCTIGLAGHASQIARLLGGQGHLIGFDRDPKALKLAGERLKALGDELGERMPKVTLVGEAFSRVGEFVSPGTLDGLLADFGVSSMQLDEAERGFSFLVDGPLDMRQDTRQEVTAERVVNEMDESDLANLIYEYGEERRSRRIARAVVRARPVTSTGQLARIVAGSAPAMKGERIHPATRTFQALRIHVNRELSEINDLLQAAPKLLKAGPEKPGGRLVVISFHSLEDRIAKDALRDGATTGIWTVLTRKPVMAGELETERNPRARSAKMRAAEMLGVGEMPQARRAEFKDAGSGVARTGFALLRRSKKQETTGKSPGMKTKAKKKRLRD